MPVTADMSALGDPRAGIPSVDTPAPTDIFAIFRPGVGWVATSLSALLANTELGMVSLDGGTENDTGSESIDGGSEGSTAADTITGGAS